MKQASPRLLNDIKASQIYLPLVPSFRGQLSPFLLAGGELVKSEGEIQCLLRLCGNDLCVYQPVTGIVNFQEKHFSHSKIYCMQ
jgi:hypothetical protein